MKHYFLFGLILLGIFSACDNAIEPVDRDQVGYAYFPYELGKYWEYEVDSITLYDEAGGVRFDSTKTFIREEIIDEQDGTLNGEKIYTLAISKRDNSLEEWAETDRWQINMSDLSVTRTEENAKLTKVVFPTNVGKTWDGVAFINSNITVEIGGENVELYKDWDAEIISRNLPETYALKTYEDILTIIHADEENEVSKRYEIEKYAFNVGLVRREMIILDSSCAPTGILEPCIGQPYIDIAYRGFLLTQTLLDFN